jgi:uncharacterized protein (TIGR00299 family) protein
MEMMNKLAYLECPTGIAGDMCLGALVDIGVPLDYLISQLRGLGIEQEYQLRAEKVHRNGQIATKVYVVDLDHHDYAHARHLPEIEALIQEAKLPPQASAWSLKVFRQLAVAEGEVHGIAPEKVHFHEVGATDAIVDIVGTCLGLDWLGINKLNCSALPTGGGTVRATHGQLPVPVPAVLKLWESRQVPVYSNGIDKELVTPTGAALAVSLASNFGGLPAMTVERLGLGAGSHRLPIPNMLRLWIGQASETTNYEHSTNDTSLETIAVLETQIDDLSPQAVAYTFEILFEAGAVDVFTQGIGMKKSRLGILLTVICPPQKLVACETVLFRETTTLGIRRQIQQRAILQREIQQVTTPLGTVRVKVAGSDSSQKPLIANVQPEYEDCAQLARQHHQPWRVVHQMALDAWSVQYQQE